MAMTDYVIGIDIGTTGTKAVLLRQDGKICGKGYCEYSLNCRPGKIAEQNACDWWDTLVEAVGAALDQFDCRHDIRAISLSTQGASMTAVDKNFTPLCPALTWMDSRAQKESEYLNHTVGQEAIYRKCGWPNEAYSDISKILWLKNNRRDIYDSAYSFVSTIEYVNFHLTGRNISDPTNAAIRGMYNINTFGWDSEILSAAGVSAALLPECLPTGAYIGTLTEQASKALRLPQSVRVYNGAHDQYCAALGCGAVHTGDMLLSCGTTWVVLGVTDHPVYTESRISPGKHPCGTLYGAMASLNTAGSALKWLCGIVGENDYAHLDRIASQRIQNAAGLYFMPYLAGSGFPCPDYTAGGNLCGLRLHHDQYDIALALMEGVAFETKAALEEFKNSGIDIRRLKMVGGAAKSALWSSITGYVTGCEITTMTENEGCAVGAALIAAVGEKFYPDYESAVSQILSGQPVRTADPTLAAYYQEKNKKYRILSDTIKGVVKTVW